MAPSAKNTFTKSKPLSNMISALQRARTFLTPTSSSPNILKLSRDGDAFTKAPTTTALFPTVDPAIDGEDCDHDCATCTIEYPKKFSIDEDDKLYGHVKAWHTHMLVATGKTDWVRDVADEKGSVMEAVGKHGQQLKNGKLMLSASNMPLPCDGEGDIDMANPGWGSATTILLLPSWTVVEGVRPGNVPELLDGMVAKSITNMTPLKGAAVAPQQPERETANGAASEEKRPPADPQLTAGLEQLSLQDPTTNAPLSTATTNPTTTTISTENQPAEEPLTLKRTITFTHAFHTHPSPHLALILLCSQKTRDARCGQSAPLLRREFERHLRPLGLYRDIHDTRPGGVGIYFISHVGGHKYSANVMVYRRKGIERLAGLFTGPGLASGAGSGTSTPMSLGTDVNETEDEGAVQGIWLARVRPEDCEGIVKFTVLQGKVVKPERQLRGGFDRERGLVSW
jgi:hypothetical protein